MRKCKQLFVLAALALTLTLAVCASSLGDGPYTDTVGDTAFTFIVENGGAVVTDMSRTSVGTASVPAALTDGTNTYPVTQLGDGTRAVTLTNVNVLDMSAATALDAIAAEAFDAAPLRSVLTIPNSVTSIGDNAFRDCAGISSLTLGSELRSIGDNAFIDCEHISGALVIPNKVTSIGEGAFENCGELSSLTLGSSLETLGEWAFFNCYGIAGTLSLPDSLTVIPNYAFNACDRISAIEFGSRVSSIGGGAFWNNRSLSGTLTLPDTVTSIGGLAFRNCTGITGLSLGSRVEAIGDGAFELCRALGGQVVLPAALTSLGSQAFADTLITGVLFLGAKPTLGTTPLNGTAVAKYTAAERASWAGTAAAELAAALLSEEDIYPVSVTNGSMSSPLGIDGWARVGDTVTVTGNDAGLFVEWSALSANIELADADANTTTFEMPAARVSLLAIIGKVVLNIETTETGYIIHYTDGTNDTIAAVHGPAGTDGQNGSNGAPGANGQNGAAGADGQNGRDGADGADGRNGRDGADGADGVGIRGIALTESDGNRDSYTITLTNGAASAFTVTNGVNGADGAGIASASVTEAGELEITLTDGSVLNAGRVRGESAAPSDAAAPNSLRTLALAALIAAIAALLGNLGWIIPRLRRGRN